MEGLLDGTSIRVCLWESPATTTAASAASGASAAAAAAAAAAEQADAYRSGSSSVFSNIDGHGSFSGCSNISDGRCLVVTGYHPDRGPGAASGTRPYHVTIVPLPSMPAATAMAGRRERARAAEKAARTLQQQQQRDAARAWMREAPDQDRSPVWLTNDGDDNDADGGGDEAELFDEHMAAAASASSFPGKTHTGCSNNNLNALHFTYGVSAPFPRPCIVGFEVIAPPLSQPPPPLQPHSRGGAAADGAYLLSCAPTSPSAPIASCPSAALLSGSSAITSTTACYRLVLNTGDGLKCITFGVGRSSGVFGGDDSGCGSSDAGMKTTLSPASSAFATASSAASAASAWFSSARTPCAVAGNRDCACTRASNSNNSGASSSVGTGVNSFGPQLLHAQYTVADHAAAAAVAAPHLTPQQQQQQHRCEGRGPSTQQNIAQGFQGQGTEHRYTTDGNDDDDPGWIRGAPAAESSIWCNGDVAVVANPGVDAADDGTARVWGRTAASSAATSSSPLPSLPRGGYSLANGLRLLATPPSIDPRSACGTVILLSHASLDVEQLLTRCVKGRVRNYDLRLVKVVDGVEAAGMPSAVTTAPTAPGGGGGSGATSAVNASASGGVVMQVPTSRSMKAPFTGIGAGAGVHPGHGSPESTSATTPSSVFDNIAADDADVGAESSDAASGAFEGDDAIEASTTSLAASIDNAGQDRDAAHELHAGSKRGRLSGRPPPSSPTTDPDITVAIVDISTHAPSAPPSSALVSLSSAAAAASSTSSSFPLLQPYPRDARLLLLCCLVDHVYSVQGSGSNASNASGTGSGVPGKIGKNRPATAPGGGPIGSNSSATLAGDAAAMPRCSAPASVVPAGAAAAAPAAVPVATKRAFGGRGYGSGGAAKSSSSISATATGTSIAHNTTLSSSTRTVADADFDPFAVPLDSEANGGHAAAAALDPWAVVDAVVTAGLSSSLTNKLNASTVATAASAPAVAAASFSAGPRVSLWARPKAKPASTPATVVTAVATTAPVREVAGVTSTSGGGSGAGARSVDAATVAAAFADQGAPDAWTEAVFGHGPARHGGAGEDDAAGPHDVSGSSAEARGDVRVDTKSVKSSSSSPSSSVRSNATATAASTSPSSSQADSDADQSPATAQGLYIKSHHHHHHHHKRPSMSLRSDGTGNSTAGDSTAAATDEVAHGNTGSSDTGPLRWSVTETPPTRSKLVLLLDVITGTVKVISLSKMAPNCQPAFDTTTATAGTSAAGRRNGSTASGHGGRGGGAAAAAGGGVRTIATLTSQVVTSMRSTLHIPPHPSMAPLELTNDAVITGRSLPRLVNPVLPTALVI